MGPGGNTQHAWRASAYQCSVKWNVFLPVFTSVVNTEVTRMSPGIQAAISHFLNKYSPGER